MILKKTTKGIKLDNYCVNKNAQDSGEHEVHKEGCKWYPSYKIDLGYFLNCHGAVEKAIVYYSNVDGCKHCCPDCHTK